MTNEINQEVPTTIAEAVEANEAAPVEVTHEEQAEEQVENQIEDDSEESDSEEVAHNAKKPSIKLLKEKFRRREAELRRENEQLRQLALQNQPGNQNQITTAIQNDPQKPKLENFKSIDEYNDAHFEYKMAIRDRELQAKKMQEQTALTQQTFVKKAEEFAKSHEDYYDTIEDASSVPLDRENLILQTIIESEVGPQLGYHLAKNPELIAKLVSLPPTKRLVELGKIEAKLSEPAVQKKAHSFAPAPAPIKPVTGKAHVTNKSEYEMTPAELIAYRQARDLAKMGYK